VNFGKDAKQNSRDKSLGIKMLKKMLKMLNRSEMGC
jgi:hypothetical protein